MTFGSDSHALGADFFTTGDTDAVAAVIKAMQSSLYFGQFFNGFHLECCNDFDVAEFSCLFCLVSIQRITRMVMNF